MNQPSNQPPNDDYLRRISEDTRFLAYRAGRPHPLLVYGILLPFGALLLLLFAVTFVIEVGEQARIGKHDPGQSDRPIEFHQVYRVPLTRPWKDIVGQPDPSTDTHKEILRETNPKHSPVTH